MARRFFSFLLSFVCLLVLMALGRLLFLIFMNDGSFGVCDAAGAMLHGVPLDICIAGYAMIGVGLLLTASVWTHGKWLNGVATAYFICISGVLSASVVLNLLLYPYWQFPLASTPVFYFLSSPADALASVSGWYVAMGLATVAAMTAMTTWLLRRAFCFGFGADAMHRLGESAAMVLLTAALFLPIRGGVTVSTMNTGRAYFSENMLLNHAAVNPVLSLMESLLKEGDFSSQYRFMSAEVAEEVFHEIMMPRGDGGDVAARIIDEGARPDIVMLILEGFSSHLLGTLGGENGIAVELDSIGRRGLMFSNFYATSFRTDRGLVSILSGFPSQPTSSVMKYPRKTSCLPGIAKTLRGAGYQAAYYYGGDADFTNMRSYLRNTGFERIVCDSDFPLSERLSKWGVHDHVLFEKLKEEFLGARDVDRPRFCVVQTSSSHEPFEVPYAKMHDKRQNAFCYTDSVVGDFVRRLEGSRAWKNTLVVIVPDHMGGYPDNIPPTSVERYKIPLIMTGGALRLHGDVATLGDQTDIAATLLSALGMSADDFPFSKDLLNPALRHRAYFSFPDLFGWIDTDGTCIFDNGSGKTVYSLPSGASNGAAAAQRRGKAYLQKIYDVLGSY